MVAVILSQRCEAGTAGGACTFESTPNCHGVVSSNNAGSDTTEIWTCLLWSPGPLLRARQVQGERAAENPSTKDHVLDAMVFHPPQRFRESTRVKAMCRVVRD